MYKKILVPLDGSELSESILEHVITITTDCKVPKVILMRVRKSLDKDVRIALDPETALELDQTYHDDAANYLKSIAKALEQKDISVKIEVLEGDPAKEILKYSKNNDVDLIIMSTHGRSGVSRIVFGSVADKVIRQTEAPVLIRPASHRSEK
jgi:nucleotide-binding universal stress UspA family protein